MRKTAMTILVVFICFKMSFAQNVENKILQIIYEDAIKHEKYKELKSKLKGTIIVIEPASGESSIRYANNIDDKIKNEFGLLSKDDQFKVLNDKHFPILLDGGPLHILDSLNFFSQNTLATNDGAMEVKIIRKSMKDRHTNVMKLSAIGIRKNNLIISFLLNDKKLYNYYFDLTDSNILLLKTSIVDK